jgi:hypothetical protein
MDVVSISLGISGGWEEDVLSVMADRLVSKGVHGALFVEKYVMK